MRNISRDASCLYRKVDRDRYPGASQSSKIDMLPLSKRASAQGWKSAAAGNSLPLLYLLQWHPARMKTLL